MINYFFKKSYVFNLYLNISKVTLHKSVCVNLIFYTSSPKHSDYTLQNQNLNVLSYPDMRIVYTNFTCFDNIIFIN